MIVVKEENGTLYVGDIGPARSQYTPGDFTKPWTPIGPGLKPTVTVTGTKFYVTFEYLGHTYVRELDPAVWPPEVIDPTTYTPNISLEEPRDAVAFGIGVNSPASVMVVDSAWDQRPVPSLLERVTTNIIYNIDTGEGSIDLQRKTSVAVPDPVLFKGWRVYRRTPAVVVNSVEVTPAGPWELLFDWQTEVTQFSLIRDMSTGVFREELALAFGYLWQPGTQNQDPALTGNYLESSKGPSVVIDSDVEPKTLQSAFTSPVQVAVGTGSEVAWPLFGESQQFFSIPAYDEIQAFGTQKPAGLVLLEAQSSAFVAAEYASPGGLSDFFNLSQGIVPSQVILYA